MQIENNTEAIHKIVIYYSKWGGVGINKVVTGKWRFSTYCNKSTGPAL